MASNVRRVLLCSSIALNALCAGGMFTFPLISPVLAAHCKLSQPQLTTIILAGMMSQYTIAALVGSVIDRYGPGVCSLISALSFSSGFGGFAFEVYRNPDALPESATALFYRFTFFFLLVGLGSVFGYFSALFAASKSFPNYGGVASGTSLAFFGLSPLCFSVIASAFFTDSAGALNVTHYMGFIALLTTFVYTLGFINMQAVPPSSDNFTHVEFNNHEGHREEERPLLPPKRAVDPTVPELLQKTDFWLIALVCVLILGVCEMIISNIVLPNSATASQVNLISIANTISRISVGPLADFISPVAAYLPTGAQISPRKHIVSRFAFLSGSATLLVFTFTWMVYGVRNQGDIWVLSVGTGLSYSAVFTILPSLISSLWGMQNMARNFGFMMYAPFIGTPVFSYMYAFISASHAQPGEMCTGRSCWQLTFYFAIGTSIIALFASFTLWSRWRGRI
ncbi:unnamed protein product [Cyclocybe aegerita]|uniref:MFS general substrate transporter n=1 Tax=Cyclocybe aegerita TaxID=1973307 RepID=A0A8S0Y168_CYCAE|nr:unnamed protein product [Cyclocybe aegerita]